MNNIFISFIEECIMNPDYEGYVGGRIEVTYTRDQFPSEEIRFFTNHVKEFYKFRDTWDMKNISRRELFQIKDIIKEKFNEKGISSNEEKKRQ
jgi:hypothetical protein